MALRASRAACDCWERSWRKWVAAVVSVPVACEVGPAVGTYGAVGTTAG